MPSTNLLGRAGRTFMMVTALGVGLFSLRYAAVPFGLWPKVDPGIQGVIAQVSWRALAHMVVAPVALLVGPFQFLGGLRARRPWLHRVMGRVYVASCVVAGVAGLATAFHASGGPVAGWGFGILAVGWIAVTLGAWWAAVRRRFGLHRTLMRLSYAMTFAAVTLRLQIPVGFALGYADYSSMSVWLAYTSWIPNVVAVLAWSWVVRGRTAGR